MGVSRPFRYEYRSVSYSPFHQVQRTTVKAQRLRGFGRFLESTAVTLPRHGGFGKESGQNDLWNNFSLVRRQSLFHLRPFVQRSLVRLSTSPCLTPTRIMKSRIYIFSWTGTLLNSIYSWFSFLALVVRTLSMAITAANLHEESQKPCKMLRAVSRDSWSEEVRLLSVRCRRNPSTFLSKVKIFNRELSFDVIALTGLNLFSITKKFVLSAAAKIITYEIFLIQLQETTEIREIKEHFCDV